MRYSMWLSATVLLGSLLAHIWLYMAYLLNFPLAWIIFIAGGMMLFALLCLLLLRLICRGLFVRARPPEWMQRMVTQLSQHLGIREPDLYALSSDGINAFALGDARRSGMIFFHVGG